ncbi:MAG: bifunctional N-acetylglucosamine-1-phosphate uridyltransferase/glucosamine-1-phosphate acetyltransferase [Phycisphaerae bacterium]|nr:bifunctional N-acetylglucosamine-1-phosphate uridyltransferase/glucosamine-1-phosphate acetyltransferase [Phycisphaerae bacterium]
MTNGSRRQCSFSSAGSPRGKAAIILAAGKSTRMRTDLPKVMYEVCGRPMLSYVIEACRDAGISDFYLVVGFEKDTVIEAFSGEPGVHFVEQYEQKGTGHAVSVCTEAFKDFVGDVIVIAGDMPMVHAETLQTLLHNHGSAGAAASIATTVLDDPTGYGRIIRDAEGQFERIVEHRDCDVGQLNIKEVNPSYYCFDARTLFGALPQVKADNAKGEYYITDVLAIIRDGGQPVRAETFVPAEDATGINSRTELAQVAKLMQRRIQRRWMERCVTIIDPENTWIDSRAAIGPDTVIKPFSYIEGNARIGEGCSVGPFAYIADGAVVENGVPVGPSGLDALHAVNATVGGRCGGGPENKRNVRVVRRPPAQTGCQ